MDKAISLKIILHDEISKNTWNFKIPFFTQYFVIHTSSVDYKSQDFTKNKSFHLCVKKKRII